MSVIQQENEYVAELIRRVRKHKRWSQAKMARTLNVTTASVQNWEKLRARATSPTLIALACLIHEDPQLASEITAVVKKRQRRVEKREQEKLNASE